MANNKYTFGKLPLPHKTACHDRNIFLNKNVFHTPGCDPTIGCNPTLIGGQHQRMWDRKSNELYYGIKNGIKTEFKDVPSCEYGYPTKAISITCPAGYTRATEKINDGCNNYYIQCTKKPNYKFSFTKHNKDITEWDTGNTGKYYSEAYYENEPLTGGNVSHIQDNSKDTIASINEIETNPKTLYVRKNKQSKFPSYKYGVKFGEKDSLKCPDGYDSVGFNRSQTKYPSGANRYRYNLICHRR